MINRHYERTGPIGFESICKESVLSPNSDNRSDYLKIGSIEVGNSSNADAKVGWGYLVPTVMWGAGIWDDSNDAANAASPAYTDDTTDAQDAGANDFALGSTTSNDGFCVESDSKFNVVGITVGTAAGGSPVYDYTYWDGSTWANLEPFMINTPNLKATGDQYLAFLAPWDWAAFESTDDPDANEGMTTARYAVRVRATTAPTTTAGTANIIWLVRLMDYVEAVSDGKSITFNAQGETTIPFKTSLVPYCSTANSGNWISIEYRQGG